MKFGFVTCVQLGLACMEEIYAVGGELDFVITLPDDKATRKSGRIYVDEFCLKNRVELLKVDNLNDRKTVEAILRSKIDWLFIIGWSQIAHSEVLKAPRRGVLGMHPTLLPEGRGRAAIPWAIIKGLKETGVTLFQLDEGVDTGPIIAQERLPLSIDETATRLYGRVAQAHRTLMNRVWWDLFNDCLTPSPQDDSRASVWLGRKPADGRILPDMTVSETDRLVRASTRPYPGSFWETENSIFRIWSGVPAVDLQQHPVDALKIPLRDGYYCAMDYDLEPIHKQGMAMAEVSSKSTTGCMEDRLKVT